MAKYEIIFTETVKSRIVIEADSEKEAEKRFEDGDFNTQDSEELDAFGAKIEDVRETD